MQKNDGRRYAATGGHDAVRDKKYDIEALLAQGQTIRFCPQGTSMYPMFVSGQDEAIVAPADTKRLKRGDVVVYRRDPQAGGILVMHRICRRKGDDFYMAGDNQSTIEGPLRADQIRGVLVAWTRDGRQYSVKNVCYRIFYGLWLWMLPLREPVHRLLAWLRRQRKP